MRKTEPFLQRVWNFEEKEMEFEDDMSGGRWGDCVVDNPVDGRYSDRMYSTGLLDINGKDIFEGDIISDNDDLFEVVYCSDSGHASFGLKSFKTKVTSIGFDIRKITTMGWESGDTHTPIVTGIEHSGIKVVGNIYENPDLLE